MNYENVLLIGGPSDGVRMSVIEGVNHIRVCVAPNGPVYLGSAEVKPKSVAYDSVIYRRELVHTSKGFNGAVYVIDNDVDVLPALIEGYHGGRAAFEDLASARGYNTEQFDDRYVSKITQELYDFWSRSARNPK